MKILSASQVREADAYTMQHEPVSSIDLMERAALRCAHWITEHFPSSQPVYIYCGTGNNGGDGLAIARLLAAKQYSVHAFILVYSDKRSADFTINEERLKKTKGAEIHYIEDPSQVVMPPRAACVVDAILGSGLSKPVEGFLASVIDKLNSSGAYIVSIDLPSGLFADDNTGNPKDNIIRASHTLTFQTPKLTFMLPAYAPFVGDFTVLDIGLDMDFINSASSKDHFITMDDAWSLLSVRRKFSHKGDYGHALLVCGSFGKMGAAVLAGKACLRSGAGLVTMQVPECGYHIVQTCVPEAMAIVDKGEHFLTELPRWSSFNAAGVGPGIAREEQTQSMLKLLVQEVRLPLVFDADALNILGENKTWISFLPGGSILTPHPKEFERMAGSWSSDEERCRLHRSFAVKHNVYVVLKGAHTAVACPDGSMYFNSTGNPGMATGGSGDVLTGLITGLLAQGYPPRDASILGVYVHGLAGDLAAAALSEEGMTAGDIIDHLPAAWKHLREKDIS
jgi:ADP-dependent NAD(P)H-hydrate dehydratase / NAD(P)H-hydrate epimerase